MVRLLKSMKHALRGLFFVIKKEKNMQIHVVLAILAIILSFLMKLSLNEFIIVILLIFFVWLSELVNTIIELMLDYISPEFSKEARLIKDVSAASVFVVSFGAMVIGILIFYSHVINLLK